MSLSSWEPAPWQVAVAALAAWAVSKIIYQVCFHPLSKYPGPWIAKVTDLYNVYHCFVGDRHLEFHRIHARYGDVVRYGPNRVSINTVTALHSIYGPRANVAKSSHFRVFTRFFPSWSTQTIIDTEEFHHRQKRKVLNLALTDRSLRRMEAKILVLIRKFCAKLESAAAAEGAGRWSKPQDISEIAAHLSFDVMGEICFGRNFEMLDTSDHHYILNVISEGARCLNTVGHMQSLLVTGIHKVLFHKLLDGLQRYKAFSHAQCTSRKAVGVSDHFTDVFNHLLQARHEATGQPLFTEKELVCESSLLIIAGSDTTSTCIAATVFYLLHNDAALKRAQDEIRTAFSDLEDIRSGPQLYSCKYLRACIDESLRMSPPVPGLMPREVLAGGIAIDGHFFDEGVEVGTPHYALHHQPEYYPKPFAYRPERWLGDGEEQSMARRAFCPWSIGPRNCVGKAMAYSEMNMVLGRLLWQFDMRLSPGSTLGEGGARRGFGRQCRGEYQLWDTFASKSEGPLVEFRPREMGRTTGEDRITQTI